MFEMPLAYGCCSLLLVVIRFASRSPLSRMAILRVERKGIAGTEKFSYFQAYHLG